MFEKLLEIKRLIDNGNYRYADTLLDGIYEDYTRGLCFTDREENLMFALIERLSRKLYG